MKSPLTVSYWNLGTNMRHALCFSLLLIVTAGITLLSINYSWSPLMYFLSCLSAGAVLGYITGKAGYEA